MAASSLFVPPPVSLTLTANGLNLEVTLTSGQAFSWKHGPGDRWYGWINGLPCVLWAQGDVIRGTGPGLSFEGVTQYFGLDRDWAAIWKTFPDDPFLAQARQAAPGMRLLRQEPWETVCNFICSAQKQVVQIEQINRELRSAFGEEIQPGWFTFPRPERLARATIADLRECKTGYRADHLLKAAKQVAEGRVNLERVASLPVAEAQVELEKLGGVGEKVANCVLLFAYGHLGAFPIDVWIKRVMRRFYFKDRHNVPAKELTKFALKHFGPNAGYAQQLLFHWVRTNPTALPPPLHVETNRKTPVHKRRKNVGRPPKKKEQS